jgi:hypothetical protein
LQPEEKEQENASREARMEANVAAAYVTGEDEEEANEGEETEDPENELTTESTYSGLRLQSTI